MSTEKKISPPDRQKLVSADKQRENSAKRTLRGKPFQKANPYAWKRGQSGNAEGRPKYRTLSGALHGILRQVDPDDSQGRTYAELIADHLCRVASGQAKGNSTQAAREIGDRTEGKPRQVIELDPVENAEQVLANLLGRSVDELRDLRDARLSGWT